MGKHIVPQHYLQGFVDPRRPGFIWRYEKGSSERECLPIKKVMQTRGYFTPEEEQWLNDFEGPAHGVLNKVRTLQPITREEQVTLAVYAQLMLFRVEANRDRIRSMAVSVIDRKFSELEQFLTNEAASDLRKAPLLSPAIARLGQTKDEWKHALPEDMWRSLLRPSIRVEVVEFLLLRKWYLLVADQGTAFVASDTPMSYHTAIGLRQSDILLPLSHDLTLYLVDREGPPDRPLRAPKNIVEMVNSQIILTARRYVFHSADGPELAAKMLELPRS